MFLAGSDRVPTTLAFLGNIGMMEWVIILVIMLLLFGRRLPEVGKSLGQGIVEFKKGLKDVKEDIDHQANRTQVTQPYNPGLPQQGPGNWQQQQNALPQQGGAQGHAPPQGQGNWQQQPPSGYVQPPQSGPAYGYAGPASGGGGQGGYQQPQQPPQGYGYQQPQQPMPYPQPGAYPPAYPQPGQPAYPMGGPGMPPPDQR